MAGSWVGATRGPFRNQRGLILVSAASALLVAQYISTPFIAFYIYFRRPLWTTTFLGQWPLKPPPRHAPGCWYAEPCRNSTSRSSWRSLQCIEITANCRTTGDGVHWHPGQRWPIRDAADDVIGKSHLPNVWRHSVSHVAGVDSAKSRPGVLRVVCHVDDKRPVCRQVNTSSVEYYWTTPTWPGHVHARARVAGHVTWEPSDGWREKCCGRCVACDSCWNCNQSINQSIFQLILSSLNIQQQMSKHIRPGFH